MLRRCLDWKRFRRTIRFATSWTASGRMVCLPFLNWFTIACAADGHLKAYQCLGGHLLVALDGTEYFSSQKLCCQNCSSRTHKNGTVTYFHHAILPVIVAPGQEQVISLTPEFITPQDGSEKQDCEQAAGKRWIQTHATWFKEVSVTLLGDDLYSRQPLCELCLKMDINFIRVCLPTSHPALYDWLNYLEANGEVQTLQSTTWNGHYQ